jgi:hypothetical protein
MNITRARHDREHLKNINSRKRVLDNDAKALTLLPGIVTTLVPRTSNGFTEAEVRFILPSLKMHCNNA